MSDADESIANATRIEEDSASALRERGARANGAVGDSDPRQAVLDAVTQRQPDKVIVFVHSDSPGAYREGELDQLLDDDSIAIPIERRFLPPDAAEGG